MSSPSAAHTASGRSEEVPGTTTPLQRMGLSEEAAQALDADAAAVIARYPQARSALLPLLHLVQAAEGFVSPAGIEACAQWLGLTTAEVSAVATFYTMYKRRPIGDYHVGVCTNTLCAVMGGDEILADLKDHLGVGNDETTPDGKVTLEHIECNAACDYAPVVMVNWEFFDNQTPESARALVDDLRAGRDVVPTRGAKLCSFRETERLLAGFYDGRADEGPAAGPATLLGLRAARAQVGGAEGGTAPGAPGGAAPGAPQEEPGLRTGYGPSGTGGVGGPSAGSDSDAPLSTSAEERVSSHAGSDQAPAADAGPVGSEPGAPDAPGRGRPARGGRAGGKSPSNGRGARDGKEGGRS